MLGGHTVEMEAKADSEMVCTQKSTINLGGKIKQEIIYSCLILPKIS